MKRNEIVQRRVNCAGTEAVGYRPEKQHPDLRGKRKSKQRQSGEADAGGVDKPRAKLSGEPVGEKA